MNEVVKRNLYRSWYRGCKEIDIILGYFAKAKMHLLTKTEVEIFNQLLEEDDQDIYAWIVQSVPCDDKFDTLINQIKQFITHQRY